MELTFWQKLFPQRALKRAIARARIAQVEASSQRYYDAGKPSRYRPSHMGPESISAQAITQEGAENMRAYARDLDENNEIAISIFDTLVNNIVGCGVPLMPAMRNRDGSLNDQANQQMRRLLHDWAMKPTADRQTSFAECQRLLCRTWLRDGEVFVNKLQGNIPGFRHSGALPYSLEMMEPDFVPFVFNESDPRLIIQGVAVSKYFEPQAYYVSKVHPGDVWNSYVGVWTAESDYQRIPAERIIHLKFTRRINQVRGVSLIHGAIRGMEDLQDYMESERIAARIAAAMTGYVKKSPDAQTVINTETGNRDLEMSPGMIFDNLLPGEEIGTIDSNRPNTEVNNFVGGMMRRLAAATKTSYSTISRDYDGSYSSQRQSMVETKPNYDILRDYFVNQFMRPVYHDLVDSAMMTGALQIPRSVDRETIHDVHVPNVPMPWIDPKKEAEADVIRMTNNLASTSQIITERGGDPTEVAAMIENDKDLFEEVAPNELDTETGNAGADDETADSEETADAES